MRPPVTAVLLIAWLAGSSSAWAQRLKVGDPAPPFAVTEWLKGKPEDLAKGKGKKIYVLDFWATWCLPCIQGIPQLTKLQEKYRDKGVVVVSVTSPGIRRQQLSQVKKFLRDRGDAMGYTIAWDQNDTMHRSYAEAVGAQGIPYMFIVGKDGKIAWHGYPSPALERVLDDMAAGTFDPVEEANRAANEAKIQGLLPRYGMLGRSGNWEGALDILEQVIDIDPTQQLAVTEACLLHMRELHDPARLRVWIESFINKHIDNPKALATICRVLLSFEDPADRFPDLLLRSARFAYDATNGQGIEALQVYARAAHRVGHVDQAIRLQSKAVELAPEAMKPEVVKPLQYYKACKQLRDSHF